MIGLALGAVFLSTAWLLAFLFGIERSQSILASKVPTERIFLVDNLQVPANLVRAGDRGLLFFSVEAKKLNFLRWEQIKKIEVF